MENYRFETNGMPEKLTKYFDMNWRFMPQTSSFFLALGTGLIQFIIKFPIDSRYPQCIQRLETCMDEAESLCLKDPDKQYLIYNFRNIIDYVMKFDRISKRLKKLKRQLKHENILLGIDQGTRAILASECDTASIFEMTNIKNHLDMLDSFCRTIGFRLMVFFNNSHKVFGDNPDQPLMTIYEKNKYFSLLLPQMNEMNIFPHVSGIPQELNEYICEKYNDLLHGASSRLAELLMKGFDIGNMSESSKKALPDLLACVSSYSKANKEINKAITFSSNMDQIACVCRNKHYVNELQYKVFTGHKKCPCGVKLSPKNIDEIIRKLPNKNSLNCIRNKVQEKMPWKRKVERVLNCKHLGRDPFSCNRHEFCLQCRYAKLNKDLNCIFCERKFERNFSNVELKAMIDMLKIEHEDWIQNCRRCGDMAFLPEKEVCLSCKESFNN